MNILPVNEPKKPDLTPKNYLIWGESMSGKTYLARQFPNPIILNTDGNGQKIDTPSIEVKDYEHFLNIIEALKTEKHTYETVIIDLVDDIQSMVSNYVCEKFGIEHEAEAPFGRAFGEVKTKWKKLMMDLTKINMNVIFISHYMEKTEGNSTTSYPSLPAAYLNMCMGRCDMTIKCTKIGNTYIRQVTARREIYTEDLIQDKIILDIMKTIKGVFDTPKTLQKSESKVTLPKVPVKNAVKSDVKIEKEKENNNQNNNENINGNNISENNVDENSKKSKQEEKISVKKPEIKKVIPAGIKKAAINKDLINKIKNNNLGGN